MLQKQIEEKGRGKQGTWKIRDTGGNVVGNWGKEMVQEKESLMSWIMLAT